MYDWMETWIYSISINVCHENVYSRPLSIFKTEMHFHTSWCWTNVCVEYLENLSAVLKPDVQFHTSRHWTTLVHVICLRASIVHRNYK